MIIKEEVLEKMKKLRLALNKGPELRFLSHLDYAKAVSHVIRRAAIPAAYSEGFNPHMKISFSSALALGITASAEYMDLDITDDTLSAEDVMQKMNAATPKGLEVLAVKEMPNPVKKMMAICNYAIYQVTGPMIKTISEEKWLELLKPINEANEISYEKVTPKKTRIIDLKHFVKDPITARVQGNVVTLTMGIGIYPEGTVKPGELWSFGSEQYGWPVSDDYEIHREAILVESPTGRRTPLEV